jgi:hypothetical protein
MTMLAHLFDLYAKLDPGSGYWLLDDETQTYCHACVIKVAAGRAFTGYGCAAEQDGCLHCDKCGKLLDYTLTDHGAIEELNHFKTVRFNRNKPLDRQTAYHLARLIAAKDSDPEVIRIAAMAIRCMRRVPAFPSTEQQDAT